MKRLPTLLLMSLLSVTALAADSFDNPDTIVVARDGTGQFRTIGEAIEVCRAFMDYHKVILIKKGTYKEKLVIPSWLQNIELLGEDRDHTIITYDDHANIPLDNSQLLTTSSQLKLGTFRTYTLKVEGSDITLRNLTIENNAARLGQAVALHTEGDRLCIIGCRLIGHQDTVYTGTAGTRLYFQDCYICGTTDFIFGPSTAWFERCQIHSLADSYITAASTPQGVTYGYVFSHCQLTAEPHVTKVYLGRPWRPYAYTLFIYSELGQHIRPEGWENWRNPDNELTARYYEYGNTGPGASTDSRVSWSHQLSKREAQAITPAIVFHTETSWLPARLQ
ncbi:MAG: pectin esterase [Prevotella sp.]|nr:pectin esterase [Prevotella sp.]